MRITLIVLSLLLLAPSVRAGGGVWARKTVTVYDYTSAAWDGIIEETVTDLNAIMPVGAPAFLYRRMAAATHSSQPKHPRAIAIYDSDTDVACRGDGPQHSGMTCLTKYRGVTATVDVRLSNWWPGGRRDLMENIACHELMHATTGVLDNYGALPDASCVHGYLADPGSFDVAYANQAYAKDAKHERRDYRKRHR